MSEDGWIGQMGLVKLLQPSSLESQRLGVIKVDFSLVLAAQCKLATGSAEHRTPGPRLMSALTSAPCIIHDVSSLRSPE